MLAAEGAAPGDVLAADLPAVAAAGAAEGAVAALAAADVVASCFFACVLLSRTAGGCADREATDDR